MVDLGTTSVLVADDEPSTRAMVARHLRSIGYKVVEAVDGDEAFSLALEHLPDLVVLDVMMPGMSGWEVCRRIRETVSLAHTGVVMLTGIGESLNEITSPLYGADAYLDKPFEFAVLDRTLAETLEGRRDHIGRPDGADVEIVQTMGQDEDVSDAPPAKRKRSRRSAASNSDGSGLYSDREFEPLDVPEKPIKKRGRQASKAVESESAEDAEPITNKPRARRKAVASGVSEAVAKGEVPAPTQATAKQAKAKQGKLAKSGASKKKAAKKASGAKPTAKTAKSSSSRKGKQASSAGKKKSAKKARSPAKKVPRKAVAKAKSKGKKVKAVRLPKKTKSVAKKAAAKKTPAKSAKSGKKPTKGKAKKKAKR